MYKKVNKDKFGNDVSPVLANDIKNYLIDIDGTICDDIPNEQPERMATANLYEDALETLNKWYDQGHIITFFTSRIEEHRDCLLYTSPSPRDKRQSRMPSSA